MLSCRNAGGGEGGCHEGVFRFETTWQGLRPRLLSSCNNLVVNRARDLTCGTFGVGQVMKTSSKTHPFSEWNSPVWPQPSHLVHSTTSSGWLVSVEKCRMMNATFRLVFRDADHDTRVRYIHLLPDLEVTCNSEATGTDRGSSCDQEE